MEKKNSRQLRGRGFPPKKNQNSEDPSGSIRDITAHLIHDKNTSITISCTVFNFPSAGNDPGWIYRSYELLFCRPRGLRTRRPAQTGPDGGGLDWIDIRGAEASQKKNNQNSEDPSGSVRDITHHLIHDSKTSTPIPCMVFHEESAGYDPRSI